MGRLDEDVQDLRRDEILMQFRCSLGKAREVLLVLDGGSKSAAESWVAKENRAVGCGLKVPSEVEGMGTIREVVSALSDHGFDEDEMVDICVDLKNRGHAAMQRITNIRERIARTIERLDMRKMKNYE